MNQTQGFGLAQIKSNIVNKKSSTQVLEITEDDQDEDGTYQSNFD